MRVMVGALGMDMRERAKDRLRSWWQADPKRWAAERRRLPGRSRDGWRVDVGMAWRFLRELYRPGFRV